MKNPSNEPVSSQMLRLLLLLALTLPLTAQDRELVWADEFNKDGRPDPVKWTYEEGFVRNNEKQFYTKDRKENARVENGHLIIEARKETYPNRFYKEASRNWSKSQKTAQYTSAALVTDKLASWQYGRVEVRAKLPKGKGMWPAIWMMGIDRKQVGWPKCGEIDILEQLGRDPKKIHGTLHWAVGKHPDTGKEQHKSNGGHTNVEFLPHEAFHIYAIEWTEQEVAFYVDQQLYHRVDLSKMPTEQAAQFRKPHYLLINLALGGSWGGEIDDKVFPQKYLIDYVRIYQKKK